MMYGWGNMMGSWAFGGLLGLITWLELIVLMALAIAWLWRQLKK